MVSVVESMREIVELTSLRLSSWVVRSMRMLWIWSMMSEFPPFLSVPSFSYNGGVIRMCQEEILNLGEQFVR